MPIFICFSVIIKTTPHKEVFYFMGPLLTTLLSITIATSPANDDTLTKNPGAIFYTSQQLLGSPYRSGGTTPKGFDCSGFTAYVYRQHGIPLTRTAHSQYKKSLIIAKKNAVPGDLVFFKTKNGWVYHVGIYAGKNKVTHSPKPGRKVRTEEIWSSRVSFGRMS
jgi:cell wall-associated NlpC family hydrolase